MPEIQIRKWEKFSVSLNRCSCGGEAEIAHNSKGANCKCVDCGFDIGYCAEWSESEKSIILNGAASWNRIFKGTIEAFAKGHKEGYNKGINEPFVCCKCKRQPSFEFNPFDDTPKRFREDC